MTSLCWPGTIDLDNCGVSGEETPECRDDGQGKHNDHPVLIFYQHCQRKIKTRDRSRPFCQDWILGPSSQSHIGLVHACYNKVTGGVPSGSWLAQSDHFMRRLRRRMFDAADKKPGEVLHICE